MIRGRPIYLNGNDHEPEYPITRKATATGATEPAAGLAGLTVYLSATPGGTAIHATLSKSLTERASTPGLYFAIIEGTDIQTHLNNATYKGKDVYERAGNAADIDFWVIRKVVELRP